MATIDATVGGTSANSYVTATEADTYFASRLTANTWQSYVDETRQIALIQAAERMDQDDFLGERVTWEQAMKFPRYGIVDEDSRWVNSTTIPQRIKNAQCELALALLVTPTMFEDDGLQQFSRISVGQGDLDLTLRGGSSSAKLPNQVSRLLISYWAGSQSAIVRS